MNTNLGSVTSSIYEKQHSSDEDASCKGLPVETTEKLTSKFMMHIARNNLKLKINSVSSEIP